MKNSRSLEDLLPAARTRFQTFLARCAADPWFILNSTTVLVTSTERDFESQDALYAQGRTKPGAKVTWTRTSRHVVQPDGFGHAVDICPFPVDWNTPAKFDAIADAMTAAERELGINIRWGANWDDDGNPREAKESDSPHWELAL